MIERIALAALIGGILGYALARYLHPEPEYEELTMDDIIADLMATGALSGRDTSMILQSEIEDWYG